MSEPKPTEIRCPYCGAVNSVGVFCQECGKKIREETPKAEEKPVQTYQPPPSMSGGPTPQPPYMPKPNHTRKLIVAVVIGIVALGLIFGALAFNWPSILFNKGSNQTTPTPYASLVPTPTFVQPTLLPTATPSPTVAQSIEITGINLQIQYGSPDQGYFGATSQTVAISNQPNQILTVNAGSQFFLYFTLTESPSATADSISSVTVGTPGFTLVSVQPQTPIAYTPGAAQQITVTMNAPESAFNGPVELVLSTGGYISG